MAMSVIVVPGRIKWQPAATPSKLHAHSGMTPPDWLVLAGVHGGDALLATLAYRLASYWLPLCAGPPAYLLYRHRYGRRNTRPGTDKAAQR